MTERDMMLKKIGTLKFAVTDIDLFLDTHPGDTQMLKKREEYTSQLKPLKEQFEEKFGPRRVNQCLSTKSNCNIRSRSKTPTPPSQSSSSHSTGVHTSKTDNG